MKHKKMRGVVAMLLTLVMVVGMLPTSVYASDADGGGDSVVVESVSDLIEVSSVNKSHLPEKQVALLLCEARCWLSLRHAEYLLLRGGDQQRAEMHPHGDSGGAWQAKVCAFRLCRGRKKHLKA